METPPLELIPLFGKRVREYDIKRFVGSGMIGHVFEGHSDALNQTVALKFVPQCYLMLGEDGEQIWRQEVKKPNGLSNTSVVKCYGLEQVEEGMLSPETQRYVVFIYEYVPGISLKEYINNTANKISVPFVEEFLKTILALLWEMEGRGISHGDLHSGNIIVAEPKPYDVEGKDEFRITDFGVTAVSGHGDTNDRLSIATTLRELLQNVPTPADSRNRFVYETIRRDYLQRYLQETNPLADARNLANPSLAAETKNMLDELRAIELSYAQHKRGESQIRSLVTPFDFPSCEQMGNSHLLLKSLYSERFLGLRQLEGVNNLVLTGPRGCGKTTVFRALSLDYRSAVAEDLPDHIRYIGVYYRCDDLYFAFPRYRNTGIEGATDVPMHYLISTLLESLLRSVKQWGVKYFSNEMNEAEPNVASQLWTILGLQKPHEPGAERFESLMEHLRRERSRAAEFSRHLWKNDHEFGELFGPQVLVRAGACLRERLSFMIGRPIFFFIDDFSEPKITADLQENLNRLVVHRSGDIYFKISTESPVSFVQRDIDGKSFIEGREYELLNLGIEYIRNDGDVKAEFLSDLFARRFREVKEYPVSGLGQLLGDAGRNENQIARSIRDRKEGAYNYGIETLAALFSGDIHYMIRLVGKMVDAEGGSASLAKKTESPLISPKKQHDVIRVAAGEFLDSVRRLPRYGERLADIVSAFGNVSYSYLLHNNSKNEEGAPPRQVSRIEPYAALHLDGDAKDIYKELLRYSIFLEDPRGKSRRGEVVPRLYLRRYLIPHFNLTFSRRDSVEMENSDFELLLLQPTEFEKKFRIKKSKDYRTGELFEEGDPE